MKRNDFYEEYDFDSHENKVRIAAVIGTLVVTVVFGVGRLYSSQQLRKIGTAAF